jgi:hypothetical protein
MPSITISGTVIDFPDVAESPDWSEAVIEFAEAVEDALAGTAGAYDVAPQVMNIDAYNTAGAGADITNLTFSTSAVRAVIINIATYRNTATTTVSEISVLHAVYNASNGTGLKWEMSRERTGDGKITFTISDTGQVSFVIRASDGALTGASYNGLLSYSAKALLNT